MQPRQPYSNTVVVCPDCLKKDDVRVAIKYEDAKQSPTVYRLPGSEYSLLEVVAGLKDAPVGTCPNCNSRFRERHVGEKWDGEKWVEIEAD